MFKQLCCAASLSAVSPAYGAEPGTAPVPQAVGALAGCWEGSGEVTGKPVTVALVAKPIVQDAMLALDVESRTVADLKDHYSAHLLFGGSDKRPGRTADQVVGYWADSFGGGFAALGRGETGSDGFEITYGYPDYAFVNRWRFSDDKVTWQIVARDMSGVDKRFASYSLHKVVCRVS